MTTTEILTLLENPEYNCDGYDQEGWAGDDLMAKAANLLAQAVGVSLADASEYLFLAREPIALAAAKIREFEAAGDMVYEVVKCWTSGSLEGKWSRVSTMRQTEFDDRDAADDAAAEYNRQDDLQDTDRQWGVIETEKKFAL